MEGCNTCTKPGGANAFLLQEFARYYLAKKSSLAQGRELETKAELLRSGEPRALLGEVETWRNLEPPPQGSISSLSPTRALTPSSVV